MRKIQALSFAIVALLAGSLVTCSRYADDAAQVAQRAAQQQADDAARVARQQADDVARAAQITQQLPVHVSQHRAPLDNELAAQIRGQLDNEHVIGISNEMLCLHMETYLERGRWPSEEEVTAALTAYAAKFIIKKLELDTRPIEVKARQAAFEVTEELKRKGYQNTNALLEGVKWYCKVS